MLRHCTPYGRPPWPSTCSARARPCWRATPLPAFGGLEGVGRVTAIGPDVTNLKVGDRVLIGGGCWREHMVTSAQGKFPLPEAAPAEQLAMLTVNPPTAWGMLHDHVTLEPGEWVIQRPATRYYGAAFMAAINAIGLWERRA